MCSYVTEVCVYFSLFIFKLVSGLTGERGGLVLKVFAVARGSKKV